MTATTVATLVQRTRRFVRDWPDQDTVSGSLTSTATSLTVADATWYSPNWPIQVDTEAMIIRAAAGTTLTVARGAYGTTAATHAAASDILVNPAFTDLEIVDALNAGKNACFPMIYRQVRDETTVTDGSSYEYTIPATVTHLTEVSFKETGDVKFRAYRAWDVMRDSTPKLRNKRRLVVGTIRMRGYGPFDDLALGGSVDALWPTAGEYPLMLFAAQHLLASGEAGRVRFDRGLNDRREQANQVGSSMAASNSLYQRFQAALADAAMPPMPRGTVTVL